MPFGRIRPRIPAFVRRRPFPWVLSATVPFALVVVAVAREMETGVQSHEAQVLNYLVQAGGLLLPPAVTAAWWRRIGFWARSSALLVCFLWSLFALYHAASLVPDVGAFARNAPVVNEMIREPRRAMETPPEIAAAHALAAGDTAFLGEGGTCIVIAGVDAATVRRYGVRVIAGTFHDGEALTGEHREFKYAALFYAEDYNTAIRERLGIERGQSGCVDSRDFQRGERFFWP